MGGWWEAGTPQSPTRWPEGLRLQPGGRTGRRVLKERLTDRPGLEASKEASSRVGKVNAEEISPRRNKGERSPGHGVASHGRWDPSSGRRGQWEEQRDPRRGGRPTRWRIRGSLSLADWLCISWVPAALNCQPCRDSPLVGAVRSDVAASPEVFSVTEPGAQGLADVEGVGT